MDLKQLSQTIDNLDHAPPFDKWNPTNCGEIDILISADGRWWHEGQEVKRQKLIKLFASVLVEEDGHYFLKTPVEKMQIKVEDAPFVVTQWQHVDCEPAPAIQVTTNLDHNVILSEQHPVSIVSFGETQQLYVDIHRRLKAAVHRNVYYQWIEIAQEKVLNKKNHLFITSGDYQASIGSY